VEKQSLLEHLVDKAGLWFVIGAEILLAGAIIYAGAKIFSDVEQKIYENVQYQSVNYSLE
jgi:hypothetical protein